ncbi:MAG: hypothetical protein ABGY75_07695, partial [Gemmataceae bacterium]
QRIIADYQKGRITATEASLNLCEAVLKHDVAGFAQDVPEQVLAMLREWAQQLPFVGRVYRLESTMYTTPPDPKERERRESEEMERRTAGLRTWKAYFDAH